MKTGNEIVKEAFDEFGAWQTKNWDRIKNMNITQCVNLYSIERAEAEKAKRDKSSAR